MVCACDGQTYGNKFSASANRENVWYEGSCKEGNICSPANPCQNAETYFCQMQGGMCGESLVAKIGTCTLYGMVKCLRIWEPVCGCDGKIVTLAAQMAQESMC